MKRYKNLKDCIKQLEICEYKDEIGQKLESNIAFMQLKKYIYIIENEATGKPEMPGLRTYYKQSKFDKILFKTDIAIAIATICAVLIIIIWLILRKL